MGWTGEGLRTLDWAKTSDAQWLNSAAFASLLEDHDALLAGFKGSPKSSVYSPFLDAAALRKPIPEKFHNTKFRF